MKAKQLSFIFIIFLLTIFLSGYALIKQNGENISYLENRQLNSIEQLNSNTWFNKEFQLSLDDALIDNIYGRNEWLKLYNNLNMKFGVVGNRIVDVLFKRDKNNKIIVTSINEKVSLVEGIEYLIRSPRTYDELIEKEIEYNLDKIISLSKKHIEIDFYIYIPLLANDNEVFETNDSEGSYFELFKSSNIPFDYLKVNNIQDLKRMYFSTDHHWSHEGAYQGYTDIIALLFEGNKEKVRIPIKEEKLVDVKFYGSLSKAIAHSLDFGGDDVSKYIFDLPEYDLLVNGEEMEEYGHFSEYIKDNIDNSKDFDHYNWLYESRKGEIIFDTHRDDKNNILIISDSMSNAIRDVLASHFNKSIFINLDKYQMKYGDFEIENYLEKNKIDKVLFMNTLDNYKSDGEMKYLIVK